MQCSSAEAFVAEWRKSEHAKSVKHAAAILEFEIHSLKQVSFFGLGADEFILIVFLVLQ